MGERSTVTTSDGNAWSISGLAPADAGKKVYEVQQGGYTQTVGIGGITIVNPGDGGEQTGIDFANFENFTISGRKYQDENVNGVIDSEDATFLDGLTIFIDDDADGVFDAGERSTVTTSDGNPWSISGLTPADAGKKVHEVQQSGYVQTVGAGGVTIVNPGSGGEQTGIDFANDVEDFTILGTKYQDNNGNGVIDPDDVTFLGGFTIFVDDDADGVFDAGERSTVTASGGPFGSWSISGLIPADAGKKVYEVQQSGYTQTMGAAGITIVNPGNNGEQTGIDFANFENFTISGRKYQDENGNG